MHKDHWNSHITSFIFRLLVLAKNVNCICFLICVDLSARYTCILPISILGDWHCLRYYYIVCWLNSPNTFLPLFFYSQVMQRFLKSKKKILYPRLDVALSYLPLLRVFDLLVDISWNFYMLPASLTLNNW